MELKNLIMTLFCLCLSFYSCEKKETEPKEQAGRTVLAYLLAADSDSRLNAKLHQNISDMYKGLSEMDKSCTLLIYWDGMATDAYWPEPCLIKYETDGCGVVNKTRGLTDEGDIARSGVILKTYPVQISTDVNVMTNVLRDMISAAPTDNYGLIIGSHGSGWLQSLSGTRAVGVDNSGENTIEIPALSDILSASGLGKLDYLLFDDCLMGSAEVAYELRNEVKYCIASAMEIPLYGFPYEHIMTNLYSADVAEYTQKVCDAFVKYYTDLGKGFGTPAVIDCDAMDELAVAMRREILSHPELLPAVDTDLLQQYARDEPDIFGEMKGLKYSSVDMLDFVAALNDGEIPMDFQVAFDNAVVYKTMVSGSSVGSLVIDPEHYSGLGMYVPVAHKANWNTYFRNEISWCYASGWDMVL